MAKSRRINLSLLEKLADYTGVQVDSGHFNTVADFIRYDVRRMQEQERHSSGFDLYAFVQAGVDSGMSKKSGPELHKALREHRRGMSKLRAGE